MLIDPYRCVRLLAQAIAGICSTQFESHLAQLLSGLASIGTRSINKGDDGQTKLIGVPHKPHGLPVAIGLRHTEVAPDVLLQHHKWNGDESP